MDPRGRLARTGTAYIGSTLDALADRMVEYQDAIRLQGRPEKSFGGGIIDVPHFLLVVEILHDVRVPHQCKSFSVKRQIAGDQAGVEDRNLMRFGQRR